MHYAHTLDGRPESEWEPLSDHLHAVARLAGEFAGRFGAAEWGGLLGRWHDLGKYSAEFQGYLSRANGHDAHLETLPKKVDHSTAGAQHAARHFEALGQGHVGRLLAYAIAGHHAGLADWTDSVGNAGLVHRLKKAVADYSAAPAEVLAADPPAAAPAVPPLTFSADPRTLAFQSAFFCRMLFSCLVDADFLATEQFMDPARSLLRDETPPRLSAMASRLEAHLRSLAEQAAPTEVNARRGEVLEACVAAAELGPGLFSLTVPTGGGKTLASLAFALRHAVRHGRERVVYAIPFTSIIEQTAAVFRDVFRPLGGRAVLEHHSNLDPDASHETPSSRLAAENWDAPLVVTTNVQFLESLFAARTSRCRKLHRLARSVVVLDEAQTLPVELLRPCLEALRELALNYGCTVVLCTATQPAVHRRPEFPVGLEGVREIIPDSRTLYRQMKRVEVRRLGRLADDTLVDRLAEHDSFLCVVNTRAHAFRIYEALRQRSPDGEGLFHLSTLMCGAHRTTVFQRIRQRLKDDLPCRVVSTQLVEAGVDVDFPVVFRALAGVDSIAQAAGRCNREGRRPLGTVFVFEPEGVRLRGLLGSTAATTAELLPDFEDLLSLEAVERYFSLHYWKQQENWDRHDVMQQFSDHKTFQFKEAAKRFRMIEDASQPVLVPWGDQGRRLVNRLLHDRPLTLPQRRRLQRRAQRFIVPLYENVFRTLVGGDVEIRHEDFAVLVNDDLYDQRTGLRTDTPGHHEPESLIV